MSITYPRQILSSMHYIVKSNEKTKRGKSNVFE